VKTDSLLSGLVSGMTILLGVITADWLKRLRDRAEYTRRIASDISQSILSYVDFLTNHLLETFGNSTESRMSQDEKQLWDTYFFLVKELRELSESPKWPQRNAKGIREAALALRVCAYANLTHCGTYKVLLQPENAEELSRLETNLRDASRSRRDTKTITRLFLEKQEELKRQMLSRDATNA
jgi:hypothetical protein